MLLALVTLVASLAAAVCAVRLYAAVAMRPRPIEPCPEHLLIVGAHPDDCIISAGELADQVLERDGHLRIVYVTWGGDGPHDPRHVMRKAEAESSWRTERGRVTFEWLGLPTSEGTRGPPATTPEQAARATADLVALLDALPRGATVVLPAHVEEHIDHRLSRTLALEALEALGRDDLIVLEADSYNDVVSLMTTPAKALSRVLAALPFVVRLMMGRSIDPGGPIALPQLSVAGPSRLAKKCERLAMHVSQNPDNLLVRAFGRRDRFRRIDPRGAPRGYDLRAPGFVLVSGALVDASTLLLWLFVGTIAALSAALPAQLAESLAGRSVGLVVAIGFVLLALVFATRRRSPERVAIALGLLSGAGLIALT